MSLDGKAKKYLIEKCRVVLQEIENEKFLYLNQFGDKLEVISELFPDATWSKNLIHTSLVLSTIGATTNHHFKELSRDDQEKLKRVLSEGINSILDGIATDDVDKVIQSLSDITFNLYPILFGGP